MTTEQQHLATDTAESEPLLPPAPPAPLVIPRGVQLVLLLVGLLGLWVAARAARSVVEIVVVASFIALILNPFVSFLNRRGLPRGLAIPLTYLLLLLALAAIGVALAQPISNQINAFQHNVPHLVAEANKRLDSVQTVLQPQRHSHPAGEAGPDGARHDPDEGAEGLELAALVHHEPVEERSHRRVRARADLRDVRLPARLRAPDRDARSALAPRRRRHALPTTTRRGCSARSGATCAGSCCSAW